MNKILRLNILSTTIFQILTENSCDIKSNNNEKSSKFQTWKKSIPVVPVAQFEAFKVYEDKQEEKENDSGSVEIKNYLDSNILTDSKYVDNDDSVASKKNVNTNIQESPMSIDKSLVLNVPNRQLKNRQEREIFFEMPEYRSNIHNYLREAEVTVFIFMKLFKKIYIGELVKFIKISKLSYYVS